MEFHLSVTPVGQNDYLVRTEQVAPGVPLAEELVTWPVAEWLAAAGHLMNDPLKSVLQGEAFVSGGRESEFALNSVSLVALGQQFYNALFQGTLRDSWITAQGIAQNQQQVLRLRLGLKDTRLARLPWEVMHAGDRPLATGPYIAFSRYQSGVLAGSRLRTNNRQSLEDNYVKVLMVLASPTDQVNLDLLKQEAIRLQAELHRHIPRSLEGSHHLPEIELTLLDQPGREELTQALEQGRYHVLHYSGHSSLGPNGGEIYLVSSRTGLTETLSGDDLAGLLVNNSIQMVVFNSCWGTYTATSDITGDTGERNLTESLVKRGIRSVLAMSERIPDEVALTLTQLFYRNLSQGYPIDLCVGRVRQGLISAYGSHQMYWALPILYLQPEFNGFLNSEISSSTAESLDEYSLPLTATSTSMYSSVGDNTELPLPIEDILPSDLAHDPSGLDWLGEETWGDLVDEIEYDDPSYAEDSALVSDLFRQLDSQNLGNEMPPLPDEFVQKAKESSNLERQVFRQGGSQGREMELGGEVPTNPKETAQNVPASHLPLSITRKLPLRSPIAVGVVGIGAIATIIGLSWWWQNRQISMLDIPPIPTQSLISTSPPKIQDFQKIETLSLTATATEKLSQGDLKSGLLAVEELLNRGALSSAEAALNLIPQKYSQDAAVNFFKGRLAWQFVQTGTKKYSIDDARRYWENAVKASPESLFYINALGFAYYAEDNLDRANDSWFRALNLALKKENAAVPRESLMSYAGLAIGLYKSSRRQTATNKQAHYLKEAIKLRQMVIKNDPVNFQLDKLSQNWLWTEKAIGDWRSLLQQTSK